QPVKRNFIGLFDLFSCKQSQAYGNQPPVKHRNQCLNQLAPSKFVHQNKKSLMHSRHQTDNPEIDHKQRHRKQAVLYDLSVLFFFSFSAHCSTALYPSPLTVTILKPSHSDNLFRSFVIYTSTARRLVSLSTSQNSSISWALENVFFG